MQRRPSGIYEFRRRLPQVLAGKPAPPHLSGALSELINPTTGNFKQYLTVSLRTHDQKAAKRRDLDEARRVDDLFERAVSLLGGPPPAATASQPLNSFPSPVEIEQEFIRRILAADEEERNQGDPRRHHQTAAERAQWPDLEDARLGQRGMAEGHLEMLDDLNAEHLADYRRAYAKRNTDIVLAALHAYLTEQGVPIAACS